MMMDSSTARQLGVLAPVAGVVITLAGFAVVVLGVVDPFADIPSGEYLGYIAERPQLWLAAHLLIALAVLLKLSGLLIAGFLINGPRAWVARFGVLVGALGALLLVITMVRDGYVHAYLAQQWAAASGVDQQVWETTFAGSLRTSYGTELASMLCLLAIAPATFGWAGLRSARTPHWLAITGLVQGAGAVLTAIVLWQGGPSELGYGALYPVFGVGLPALWLIGQAWTVRTWLRTERPVRRPATELELTA